MTDATILTFDNDTMLASWVLSIRAWSIIEEDHLLGSIFYSDGVYEIIIFLFSASFLSNCSLLGHVLVIIIPFGNLSDSLGYWFSLFLFFSFFFSFFFFFQDCKHGTHSDCSCTSMNYQFR